MIWALSKPLLVIKFRNPHSLARSAVIGNWLACTSVHCNLKSYAYDSSPLYHCWRLDSVAHLPACQLFLFSFVSWCSVYAAAVPRSSSFRRIDARFVGNRLSKLWKLRWTMAASTTTRESLRLNRQGLSSRIWFTIPVYLDFTWDLTSRQLRPLLMLQRML